MKKLKDLRKYLNELNAESIYAQSIIDQVETDNNGNISDFYFKIIIASIQMDIENGNFIKEKY